MDSHKRAQRTQNRDFPRWGELSEGADAQARRLPRRGRPTQLFQSLENTTLAQVWYLVLFVAMTDPHRQLFGFQSGTGFQPVCGRSAFLGQTGWTRSEAFRKKTTTTGSGNPVPHSQQLGFPTIGTLGMIFSKAWNFNHPLRPPLPRLRRGTLEGAREPSETKNSAFLGCLP